MSKYVSKDFCDERFQRICEMLIRIEKKIDNAELNRKNDKANNKIEAATSTFEKRRSFEALRTFAYAAAGGLIVAAVNYILRLF